MNRLPRRLPIWICLVALLAAQIPHVHHEAPPAFDAEFGACDESGAHWAGHHAADPGAEPETCATCRYRAQPAVLAPIGPVPAPLAATPLAEVVSLHASAGSPLRGRSRAPPGD